MLLGLWLVYVVPLLLLLLLELVEPLVAEHAAAHLVDLDLDQNRCLVSVLKHVSHQCSLLLVLRPIAWPVPVVFSFADRASLLNSSTASYTDCPLVALPVCLGI